MRLSSSKTNISLSFLFILMLPFVAHAVPSVTSISGTLSHGTTVTVSGSGFGSKASAAPLVWDNCSGTAITNKWSGAWPNAGISSYWMRYTTPINGVNLPHNRISKYMAGAHGDSSGANAGYDVLVYKTLPSIPYPTTIYLSAYYRLDPAWSFDPAQLDNNLKTFQYGRGGEPYGANFWYAEYNSGFTSATGSGYWHLNDSGTLMTPDAAGHSWWWNSADNPYAGWIKQEIELKITNQTNGYLKIWENGVLKVNYAGSTDKWIADSRVISIGGYARRQGQPHNFRYFADLYLDTTPQRVMICSGSSWANRGKCEVQVPETWTDNATNVKVNQGAFADNSNAYLYVVDANGTAGSGKQITFGSGSTVVAPSPPSVTVVAN